MTYFDYMMGLKDGIADKYEPHGAVITHIYHGPEDQLGVDGPHRLEIFAPYPKWEGGGREFLRVDANGEEWEERLRRARMAMARAWQRRWALPIRGTVTVIPAGSVTTEGPDERGVYTHTFTPGFGIEPQPCYACKAEPGRDDKHQPWCPEVGGWWCAACQAYSPPGPACVTCQRERKAAEVWSPYAECPACGASLPDDQGERARCAECGWEEGE